MNIQKLINNELENRNWSRKKLAKESGIPESTLSLKLAPQKFDTDQIQKIAQAFNWTPSELIQRAENK